MQTTVLHMYYVCFLRISIPYLKSFHYHNQLGPGIELQLMKQLQPFLRTEKNLPTLKKKAPTPRKFNIAPKNRQSQKETHLPTIIFQGLC